MKLDVKAFIIAGLTIGAIAGLACSRDLPLEEGQPCPCASGWTCCESDRTCSRFGCASDDDDDRGAVSSAIATLADGSTPLCIAADPMAVYWMNADGSIAAGSTISKQEVRSLTNPPVTKVEHCAMLRSGDGLYVAAAEDDAVYWFSVSAVGAEPVVGESFRKIAAINNPVSLAEDATYLYVLNGTTGEIRRYSKVAPSTPDAGSDASTDAGTSRDDGTLLGASGAGHASSLLLDGDTLYWFDKPELHRMPKTGGTIATIATVSTSSSVRNLRAGGGNLYWLESETLMTLPIAGGVAHALPFTPAQRPVSGNKTSAATNGAKTSTPSGNDDDVYAFAATERGLLLARTDTVGVLGYEGGKETLVFTYQGSTYNGGVQALLFDTSRFIWIAPNNSSIQYRPLLETDAKP